mmetsp:Transcript_3323/g.4566  ORF Transcript_3323/g.4566 Transcript_3323/m.4566 type:complete len:1271 (+) Transcript_3323:103-3915(+)
MSSRDEASVKMLAKLETKSNRVKGLSFHPTRPWILASLHNGIIQLWDYRIRTLVDKFDEHDGPVRGVCFHNTQPLFVSGGDDYKIKVWNYKQRRCLFTLLGHLDYIRTVQFHHEYPWILSASDDQTIRIWNWQSRNCISVLTGHNHYVMCASFHPKEDLVVSASLDQTVRVWDISGLRKKNVAPGPHGPIQDDGLRLPQNDLFGNTDAIVKYVLEGHDRGVNWAAFHPSSPLIVSGADDRQVKLWRMNDTRAWEVDTFRGHFNNVSCVLFHPKQELLISNSEDKTIRVWDIQKRAGIQTFRREHDRFWILAAHPDANLFAAGHDSGMVVFKLERERPAYSTIGADAVFYVKDRYIRSCEFSSSRDVPVLSLRTRTSASGVVTSPKVRSLAYNAATKAILLTSDTEGGTYEIYQIPKDNRGSENVEAKKGAAVAAVFVGKKFAILDRSHQVIVKSLKSDDEGKKLPLLSGQSPDYIFAGPLGTLLMRCDDKLVLYDVQQKKSIGEMTTTDPVKYVYWSNDKNPLVALVSKDSFIIANRKLEQLCTVHETIRIKSGAWDENGIFIYSTSNHIKFCLPNGDNGIVRTLESPLYITSVKGNRVYCLDRECRNRVISVDTTEYMFKQALVERKYATVLKMVKEYNLIGQAIISYLQKKGFPEVALYFVKDNKTRFNLALESGNIEVAFEAAKVLDDKDCWNRLGTEALRQGNHQIVETAYQRTKNFERLSFLYLITGNVGKLKKMMKISEMRNDVLSRFHNALYLGDVAERLKMLEEAGQISLAYLTATAHGLTEQAEALQVKLVAANNNEMPAMPSGVTPLLLQPPIPIMKLHESNWPLLTVQKGYFDGPIEDEKKSTLSDLGVDEEFKPSGNWDDNILLDDEDEDKANLGLDTEEPSSGAPEKSEWDLDLDIGGELPDIDVGPTSKQDKSFVIMPQPGPSFAQIWCGNSTLPADHVAAGSFESAMKLLNQQIGAVNFAPLKSNFLSLYSGARVSVGGIPSIPSVTLPVQRTGSEVGPRGGLPQLAITLQSVIENKLKPAYKATTAGKFGEALQLFLATLHSIPLLVVDSKKEVSEAKEMLGICREYVTGLRMELQRKDLATANGDPIKQAELAAYFTHCNLQAVHIMLSLRSAMNCCYKIKNYQTAAAFARRLIDLDPPQDVAVQAKKVVKFAEQNNSNAHNLNYNERNPFIVCGISFAPIYRGSPSVNCPFCQASFLPQYKDQLCPTCKVSQIGKDVSGLQLYVPPKEVRRSDSNSNSYRESSRDRDDDGWD